MGGRAAYPGDLSDEQWAVLGPFLRAGKATHPSVSGHQGRYDLREIVNAIFYQNRTGCRWAYLPLIRSASAPEIEEETIITNG